MLTPEESRELELEKARKRPVPDTEEQRTWVEQYATGLQIAGSLKVAEKEEPYKTALTEQAEDEIEFLKK